MQAKPGSDINSISVDIISCCCISWDGKGSMDFIVTWNSNGVVVVVYDKSSVFLFSFVYSLLQFYQILVWKSWEMWYDIYPRAYRSEDGVGINISLLPLWKSRDLSDNVNKTTQTLNKSFYLKTSYPSDIQSECSVSLICEKDEKCKHLYNHLLNQT